MNKKWPLEQPKAFSLFLSNLQMFALETFALNVFICYNLEGKLI